MLHGDDMILISVDDHICEPADMFDAHVPAKYKDRAPRVLTDENGFQQWWYGDNKGRNLGLNAVAGKPREMFNVNPSSFDEMRPGCYDVHERVRDMSAGGQLAGLNFPNWTGFSGQVLSEGPDRDVNLVMIKAYNDWHVDEWCGAYPERFIPCGIVPLFDSNEAAIEVRRLAAKGCHAVTFSENPARSVCHRSIPTTGIRCSPRVATKARSWPVTSDHPRRLDDSSPDAPPSIPMNLSSTMSMFTLVDLVWAEFWNRFPTLKFSLTEGDIGWIPYVLQRGEHIHDRHSGWTAHEFPAGMSPTDIFKRNIMCCFIKDRIGVKLLDEFNVDNVCWESDFPHSDSSWPFGPEALEESVRRALRRCSTRSRTRMRCAITSSIRSRCGRRRSARCARCVPRPSTSMS